MSTGKRATGFSGFMAYTMVNLSFGDDWLPISDWMERFLLALLHWPGCRINSDLDWEEHGIDKAQVEIEKMTLRALKKSEAPRRKLS